MKNKKLYFLKSKQKYLHLIYTITEHIIAGNKPSGEMIKEARELGRQMDIPEEELKNLGLLNLSQRS